MFSVPIWKGKCWDLDNIQFKPRLWKETWTALSEDGNYTHQTWLKKIHNIA